MEDYRLEQSGQEVQDILDGAAMQSDLTAETERATEAEQTLQGNIDIEERDRKAADLTLQGNIDAEELRAKAAEKQNADDIDALEEKVPSGASASNKLATESYVDDSVATATATFRGTYNLVSDLHLTVNATEQQIATALALAISTADNNDYCFVQVPTSSETPTEIKEIDRYKFNGTAWSFEYKLNNSGFTTAQWAAINSGITSGDVTKLAALPTNAQLTTLLAGKQDVLTFDNVPTESSNHPVKSGGVYSAIDDEKTARENADSSLSSAIEAILLLIPSAATSLNKLADKAFVNSSIATASATFRGTYNLVTDLSLTVSATHAQIATALAGAVSDEDNNDYAFVQIPTSDATPTQIAKTERYKFNGTAWEYEYDLNNSGYTAAQWAAINSGITEAFVTKLSALPTNTELTSALGVLTSSITTINQKIPSAASQANQLVDTAAMEAYIVQVLDVLTASFNVTSTDGHVTVSISQVDGKITSVSVSTSDIASAASLSLIAGRVTTAEGNISTNAADIANLQDAYAALTQSALVVVQPTDTWPVASPATSTIYRVVDRVNTPPQYYSDYMWNGTSMVPMATYDNAIDDKIGVASSNNIPSTDSVVNYVFDVLAKQNSDKFINLGEYLEIGNISGIGSGSPISYVTSTTKIRTKEGTTLHLRKGDVLRITDYTDAEMYIGWWRDSDGTYGSTYAWVSSDYEVSVDGRYIFIVRNKVETDVTMSGLGSMVELNHSISMLDGEPTPESDKSVKSGNVSKVIYCNLDISNDDYRDGVGIGYNNGIFSAHTQRLALYARKLVYIKSPSYSFSLHAYDNGNYIGCYNGSSFTKESQTLFYSANLRDIRFEHPNYDIYINFIVLDENYAAVKSSVICKEIVYKIGSDYDYSQIVLDGAADDMLELGTINNSGALIDSQTRARTKSYIDDNIITISIEDTFYCHFVLHAYYNGEYKGIFNGQTLSTGEYQNVYFTSINLEDIRRSYPNYTFKVVIYPNDYYEGNFSLDYIKGITKVTVTKYADMEVEEIVNGNLPYVSLNGMFLPGRMWNRGNIGDTIDVTDIRQNESGSVGFYLMDSCKKGDEYIVSANAGNAWRALSFVDAEYKLLFQSNADAELSNLKVIAPSDGFCIVNSYYGLFNVRKKTKTLSEKIETPWRVGGFPVPSTYSPTAGSWSSMRPEDAGEITEESTLQEIYDLYDGLVAAYPNYITKNDLGMDASGTYHIYNYVFKPENLIAYYHSFTPKPFPRLLLMGGIHGNGYKGDVNIMKGVLYYFLKDMCENYKNNEALEFFRRNVIFDVIPVINPWGHVNNMRTNANGVDLNRNSQYHWIHTPKTIEEGGQTIDNPIYSGEWPLSEAESQIIFNWVNNHKDSAWFFDIHAIGGTSVSSQGYMMYGSGLPDINWFYLFQSVVMKVSDVWNTKNIQGLNKNILHGMYTDDGGEGQASSGARYMGVNAGLFEGFENFENSQVPSSGSEIVEMLLIYMGHVFLYTLNYVVRNFLEE